MAVLGQSGFTPLGPQRHFKSCSGNYKDQRALRAHLEAAVKQEKAAKAHDARMQAIMGDGDDDGDNPAMNNRDPFAFSSGVNVQDDGWKFDGTTPTGGIMPALAHRLLLRYMNDTTD